jgi:hypothetical protein
MIKSFGLVFFSALAILGLQGPVNKAQAQPYRPTFHLLDFNSHELMDDESMAELFANSSSPHDFEVFPKEKNPRHHPWTYNLIRSATQSLFLNSGFATFPGSNFNIPPTLKAYQTP